MVGEFEIKEEDLAGRIGILSTLHGNIETPTFFPVINPVKSEITVEDIKKVGFNNIITNAYLVKKNLNIKSHIHDYFSFNGIIMTDSGAYQILQYGEISISNKEIVEYELEIKPDIAVILDVPTGDVKNESDAKLSVDETLRRINESLPHVRSSSDQIIWVYPIQGGRFLDLLAYSAKYSFQFDEFKMLALGSPTVLMQRYEYVPLIDMIYTAKSNVTRGKAFHLFGGGLPHIMPFAVALGVDSFDSASYILYARDNRYITRDRVYRLEELEYFPCSCPVCSKYTPKDLQEMEQKDRTRLLAIHNLYVIKEEINAIKQSIKEGRLFEYLQQKAFSHPRVYDAFKSVLKYADYLEKFDPRTKGEIKGVFLYNKDSLARPEIKRHERLLREKIIHKADKSANHKKRVVITCEDGYYDDINSEVEVYLLNPFYGPIPIELKNSFPYSQYETPTIIDDEIIEQERKKLKDFLYDMRDNISSISVIKCEKLHINSTRDVPIELFLDQL
ncbi:tRNA guanosine(15) transglycosylase TgtA [Stygiolobus caldivivus]|uniref:tRNA-guanine(15) transglycosylase n=1 Tax=Stygiolobus caldivivus TaxID=2824673 RepID=A0A8D5U777_9CREN|nr:tRNA guanosine(15) transglycosylase TgtA [Stygiolobus caldivivus]BCU70594.1 tRNA guanosine(15) transglycosylase TgtA [Stygiolobus caldivivus]